MPTVPKTSDTKIIRAARRLIEQKGAAELSFALVAKAVGVRAPSLYKRFADRGQLVRAVVREVMAELRLLAERAAVTGSPAGDLRAIALAQRKFAHRVPHLYSLVFGGLPEAELPPGEYQAAVAVLVDRVGRLAGVRNELHAARMLVAFTHGFISMEIAGAFHLGGNLNSAFLFGLNHAIESLSR